MRNTGLGDTMDYGQIPKGEVLDGRFEVVRLVKSGGMGAVYQVTDRLLGGKTCALNRSDLRPILKSFSRPRVSLSGRSE